MLTIDVEDWFQVENFKPWIPFSTWDQRELRVERNIHRILDLFDSTNLQPVKFPSGRNEVNFTGPTNPNNKTTHVDIEDLHRRPVELDHFHPESDPDNKKSRRSSKSCLKETTNNGIKSTFFVLGWIAKRLPNLVREIHTRGHETASHGYNHELCHQMPHNDLKADLIKSKRLLEDIIGEPIYGYRAPSFSINADILKIIKDCGYLYDSSYNSFSLNARYGKVDLSKYQNNGRAIKLSNKFYELPISNLKLSINPINSSNPKNLQSVKFPSGRNEVNFTGPTSSTNPICFVLPWGGGGYFRLIPFHFFKYGVRWIISKKKDYLFYMHPWEIDPGQPRVREASRQYKFRHYINLDKTHSKLIRLIESFKHCRFITCKQYLDKETKSCQ